MVTTDSRLRADARGRDGDRINAVLAAAGYNFSLLLRWFEELLPALSLILWHALLAASLHLTRCRKTFFTADEDDKRTELSRRLIPDCGDTDSSAAPSALSMPPISHWTTVGFCNGCPGGAARSMSQGLRVLV